LRPTEQCELVMWEGWSTYGRYGHSWHSHWAV
jgi:hypothetical protein